MDGPPNCTPGEEEACLTGHQLVGLAFIAESAYLSIAADFLILLLVFNNLRRHGYRFRSVFQSPLDVYILSLILSDLFQGLGSALIVRWIQLGRSFKGTYCTIQGTFQSLGETSSAMATLVIAIYTFWVIAFRKSSHKMWIALLVVSLIWAYVIAFIIYVASRRGGWNEPDPYWCWIGHQHLAAQLAGEYLWLWLAGLASLVLYIPLYFIVRGSCCGQRKVEETQQDFTEKDGEDDQGEDDMPSHSEYLHRNRQPTAVNIEDVASLSTMANSPFRSPHNHQSSLPAAHSDAASLASIPSQAASPPTPNRRSSFAVHTPTASPSPFPTFNKPVSIEDTPDTEEQEIRFASTSTGLRILLYPMAYTALVLPLSIARWSSGFSTSTSHSTASRTTFVAGTIYYLSGFVNACLVLFVRRSVSLLRPPSKDDDEDKIGLEDPGEQDEHDQHLSVHSASGRRRRGTDASVGTGIASTRSRTEEGRSNSRRNKRGVRNKESDIDLKIRTVPVRGNTELPDD